MAISFGNIPSNLRVPLAWFEFDSSAAGTSVALQRALLLGTVPASAGLAPGVLVQIRSAAHMRAITGQGSALGRQAETWFKNNASVPLYVLAAAETTFGTSVGAIDWTGSLATAPGTIPLYIGGRLVRVNVSVGDTDAIIAQAVADAINTIPTLGVTASVDTTPITGTPAVTDITASQAGMLGDLDIHLALLGVVGGEMLPAGVVQVVTDMTGGTGSPDITALLAVLGDQPFDFIMSPWTGGTDLNDLDEFMNDTTGRWSWQSQLYGHAFTAHEGTIGELSLLGNSRNGQHVSIMGFFGSATPHDEWLTAYVGQASGSLIIDPARPVHSLPLIGVRAPSYHFTPMELQVLYFDGISACTVNSAGQVFINRLITTYRVNEWNAPDDSYLDIETMFTAQYFARFMRSRVQIKFPRHKLASDGTRFGVGQAIVTPAIIRAEMIAAYGELEDFGIMENIDGFEEKLIVERNANDPNRVDVLLPPDFVNQLRCFAALVQFRL